MAQSYLIFDFGANEEAAQAARHKLETWKQAFRLGKKLELKFDRGDAAAEESKKSAKDGDGVRVLVRLDFSDHEKLSHQRWVDRIPTEEPFKSAKHNVVRAGDSTHSTTADHFDSLD